MRKIYSNLKRIILKPITFFLILGFVLFFYVLKYNPVQYIKQQVLQQEKQHNDKLTENILLDLSRAIEKDPDNTSLLFDRAMYNIENEKFQSALYDLKQCVSLDSTLSEAHFFIAKVYFELSKKPEARSEYPGFAMDYLKIVLDLEPGHYRAHALLGELYIAYAKYKQAIQSLNQSLKIEYNQEKTHMLLGYSFKQLEQEDQAINCFRNAINVNPDFKEAYIQLGQIFHVKKDTLALLYYNNALNLDRNDEIVLYNKAVFYQSLLQWNEALQAYSELHNVNPFHANGHYNLGFIHMELGLHDIAANNFSDAIYSNSRFYEAYHSRGSCFETLGNIAQAESDYRRAIEINSDYQYAIDALDKLLINNQTYK